MSAEATMTRAERTELGILVRKREKVMRAVAKERSAQMIAEFEALLDRHYAWADNDVWTRAASKVDAAVADAKKEIEGVCGELRIPMAFRPDIDWHWSSGGEQLLQQRRAALRRIALTRIAAIEKEAFAKIERLSLEAQTSIIAHGLASVAAKRFFEEMPELTELMPPVALKEVNDLLAKDEERFSRIAYYRH